MTKLVFFGGGKYAVPALEALREHFDIAMVVTNPEKPVGRKQIPVPSAVEEKAKELQLPVKIVHKYDEATIEEIRSLEPDLMVIVDYGKIVPQDIIDIPPKGAINVHPSALPKYRGASPLQTAILNGETETAISIMLIDDEMDHGPILMQKTVKIDPEDTYGTLYTRLADEYPPLLIEAIKGYLDGSIEPKEQDHSKATFTKLLKRSDGEIDWSKPADEIVNMIRAYDPWPGTFTRWNKKSIKVFKVAVADKTLELGNVLVEDKRLFIGTGSQALELLELQPEGKSKMDAASFLNGNPNIEGAML